MLSKIVAICCCISVLLFGETVETFYGPVEVDEPVLLELLKHPALLRLEKVHQYGIAYYTTHREEYSRFDHSVGVFALLKKNGASLEEQISGLLHDVSHTVFSHVGDWIFGKEYQEEDYQSIIYKNYLSHSGIEDVLMKYGYTINQIYPKNKAFTMLEQPLPNLCADRIEYNLQGAYYQKFLTKKEVLELYHDLRFIEGKWVGTRVDLLKKLARFPLFMTEDCWGSAANYALSRWLADAMIKGLATGLLSWKEIHVGIDDAVWDKLIHAKDDFIQQRMRMIADYNNYFERVDLQNAEVLVRFRCRGVDPWVIHKGQTLRLTQLDPELAKELEIVRQKAIEGRPIKLLDQSTKTYFSN